MDKFLYFFLGLLSVVVVMLFMFFAVALLRITLYELGITDCYSRSSCETLKTLHILYGNS